MPGSLDLAFLFAITVVLTVVEATVFFPRFKAAALANVPGTRGRAYRRAIVGEWACVAIAVAIWVSAGRAWHDLGLVPPDGIRRWASALLVIVVVALVVQQARAIGRATAERKAKIRPSLDAVAFLLPHSRDESRWFAALSVTAGVCEELLYRGYLVWVLRPFVGTLGAMGLGVALFAAGHAYQGWRGVIKTGAVGAVMSALVLATGWLGPAMVLHALIDLNAGILGYAVFRETPEEIRAAAA